MKTLYKAIIILSVQFICSCRVTARGCYTGTEYTAEISEENGIMVKAMPLRWQTISKTYKRIIGNDDK